MNRRQFLTATSAAIPLLAFSNSNAKLEAPPPLHPTALADHESLARVTQSIKAHFGAGFSVISANQVNSSTICCIEHLGNRYTVASADLTEWHITHATPM